jgi:S-(hydroxymethyl)glutathione dehydrogenase/alcohol dehydrogenase
MGHNNMKAVVVDGINEFSVQDVELDPPKAGEVRVKMVATGVCRSDYSVISGHIPVEFPIVVGHEGAGIIAELGEGVDNFAVGDHVVLSFVPECGECFYCKNDQAYLCASKDNAAGGLLDGTTRVHRGGEDISVMTQLGCMAEECIAPSISCVKIDDDIPLNSAALIGCGVMTGVGAALNAANVQPGTTAVIFGCGGIGLSAIQGARIAGAKNIVAVDTLPAKLDVAKSFGATHGCLLDEANEFILGLTEGRGADYCFEAVGITDLMQLAEACTRPGGICTVIGVGKIDEQFVLNPLLLPILAKRVQGTMYGNCNPSKDFPKLLDYYAKGELDLDGMITKTYSLDDAAEAFADLTSGVNARGVIVHN